MAERKALAFRLLLCSAERLSEAAMRFGFFQVNTPLSRLSALLFSVTSCDQRFLGALLMTASSFLPTTTADERGSDSYPPVTGGKKAISRAPLIEASSGACAWSMAARMMRGSAKAEA
jgi:hypothetical protein